MRVVDWLVVSAIFLIGFAVIITVLFNPPAIPSERKDAIKSIEQIENTVDQRQLEIKPPSDIKVMCDELQVVFISEEELFLADQDELTRIAAFLALIRPYHIWTCEQMTIFAVKLIPEFVLPDVSEEILLDD